MAKILIVDDEAIFIELVQERLEIIGHEIITAGDGVEGLEKAVSEQPDLILLDVLMPKMDGLTMLKEVRKNENLKNICVIMCSSKNLLDIAKATSKSSADAYINKPFDPSVYLKTIDEVLKRKINNKKTSDS